MYIPEQRNIVAQNKEDSQPRTKVNSSTEHQLTAENEHT